MHNCIWICQKLTNKSTQSCQTGKSCSISTAELVSVVDRCVAAQKSCSTSPCQDHFIHRFLFRQLGISKCNLQSESCCNYTPESFCTSACERKSESMTFSAGWTVLQGLRSIYSATKYTNYTWFVLLTLLTLFYKGILVSKHHKGQAEFMFIQFSKFNYFILQSPAKRRAVC